MNKKIVLISTIFASFASNIFTMEQDQKGLLLQPDTLALNLAGKLYLHDHIDICNFAQTSKGNYRLMLEPDGIEARKKYIEKLEKPIKDTIGITWHPYGSACRYAYLEKELNKKRLCLAYAEKVPKYKRTVMRNSISDFRSSLPHKPAPFVWKKQLYFYGYGDIEIPQDFKPGLRLGIRGVMRYGLDGSCIFCVIGKKHYSLSRLLPYPSLLKSLLDDSVGKYEVIKHGNCSVPVLVYSFDNVTIPDDYKHRIEFSSAAADDDSDAKNFFEDFPEEIKQAIERRYAEQPNEIPK